MTANRQDAAAGFRAELTAVLEEVSRKRTEYQAVVEQHKELRSFMQAEADAEAKLAEIQKRDAERLAALLVSSPGARVTASHAEQGEAERELARAKREADVARAVEPALIQRMAELSNEISQIEQRVPALAANIMFGAAQSLVSEINADAKKLRAKYARLWGLRRYAGATEAIRRRQDAMPMPTHPDHISPDAADLLHSEAAWRAYAINLAVNPGAEFKE